ncbi:ANTAR domain-containing protein [Streptomyces beigongshangae]|uniref:ANTAR domain-containing protein n=1 Tax=Streptomyces beigongshangae TaxID=2841597 RepID=UPI0027DEC8C7|nr:ANTAR domain-containing protein [Streptomyces sp. REN17]
MEELRDENAQLREAARSHAVVDRATGVVIVPGRLTPEQGRQTLREVSQPTARDPRGHPPPRRPRTRSTSGHPRPVADGTTICGTSLVRTDEPPRRGHRPHTRPTRCRSQPHDASARGLDGGCPTAGEQGLPLS